MADAKLRNAANLTKYTSFHNEDARQAAIRKNQLEIAEKAKVVTELMKDNKLQEAEVEVRKLRELDPENSALLAMHHIISNRIAQKKL